MQLSDFGASFHTSRLENGMPVYLFERPGMPITIKVAFQTGSRYDPIGKEGLAHFAEHMIVSGNEAFPTKQSMGEFIEDKGGSFNASTSSDKMDMIVEYAENADTDEMINFIGQCLCRSLFDPTTIERERGAIQSELAGKISDPGVYIGRLWKKLAYQGDNLSRDTIGSDESVASITREDLLEYYQTKVISGQGIVVVSGGISFSQLMDKLNTQEFVATSAPALPIAQNVARQRQHPIMTQLYPGSVQTHLAFGFPTIPDNHPDFWSIFVVSKLLGAGRTSRLQQKLRNDLGLVYSVRAGVDAWLGTGSLTIYTSCKREHTQQVLDAITSEVERVISDGITEEELELKKNYLSKVYRLYLQSSTAWVDYHTGSFLRYPDNPTTIIDDLQAISSVSREQLQATAIKYFTPDAWYLALCGDENPDLLHVNF